MQVTGEMIKAYFDRYAELYDFFSEGLDNCVVAMSRATKTTTQVTGMPGGGGSSRDDMYISVIEAEDKIKSTKLFLSNYLRNINSVIQCSHLTPKQRTILLERHTRFKKWSTIITMRGVEISERQAMRSYKQALERCAEWVNNAQPEFIKDIIKNNEL